MLLRIARPRNQREWNYFLFDAAMGIIFESISLFCESILDFTYIFMDIFLSRVYR